MGPAARMKVGGWSSAPRHPPKLLNELFERGAPKLHRGPPDVAPSVIDERRVRGRLGAQVGVGVDDRKDPRLSGPDDQPAAEDQTESGGSPRRRARTGSRHSRRDWGADWTMDSGTPSPLRSATRIVSRREH